ncbi:MAG TPA: 50S ribosomal protein L13 [Trueperaceae bacterium]|nr:50S ribosomal protein L13 [Trueperaceae bacterium]
MKTYFPKEAEMTHDWLIVDAKGKTVGRLATQIAQALKGKHKVDYTPNLAAGDFVIVINADKVVFSGNKMNQKIYTRYSGYQGGLKEIPASVMLEKHPDRIIRRAVWGMIPKNRMGRKIIRRLKIYSGDSHPHAAQQPKEMELN